MRPLALVGPPGSGKTTVARLIAERRGAQFVDLDEVARERHGDLGDLIMNEGSAAAASATLAVLPDVVGNDAVIAVSSSVAGGEDAAGALAGADVVYLRSDLARTFGRAGLNAPQPVGFFGTRAMWKQMLDERDPGYRDLASAVVEVGEKDAEAVADAVEEALEAEDRRA